MRHVHFGLGMALILGALGVAAAAAGPAGEAKIDSTPEQYYQGAYNNALRRMPGKYTGNGWTWHACYPMHGFLDAYLATRNTAWLDAAVKYFDWTIGLLRDGPDKYPGWLGPGLEDGNQLGEHPVGDAIMIEPMVCFAELVLKDEPALSAKYGDRAKAYVELAKRVLFEKWQKRGIWHEDGPYGAFSEWPWYYTEGDANAWRTQPGARAITMPFNMQVFWGITAARLHRITGEQAWRKQALKIFSFMKSRLCLYQDHYSWNYWEPFGPWDVEPNNPQAFCHWIGTHPYRDYQAGEVAQIVEAYHRGLAFDEQDMKRFVNTNTKVMWKGSLEKIEWNNSDAGVQTGAFGEIRLSSRPTGEFDRYAGTLWTSLAGFDPTVRRILEKQIAPGSYEYAYYYNVVAKRTPSYARRYADLPADVMDSPFSSCCTLTMAAVMPSVVVKGRPSLVSSLSRVDGELGIELYSSDGKEKVAVLRPEGKHAAGIFILPWDAKDVAPGQYRVRWSLKGEHRDFPVIVQPEMGQSTKPASRP